MRQVSWELLKNFIDQNSSVLQVSYIDLGDRYDVWGQLRGYTIITKDLLKGGSECSDFETCYKLRANIQEADRVRITTCRIGRTLHDRFITFVTSDQDNFDNSDWKKQDLGDVTYSMKDADGNTTTDNSLACETHISFYPQWDYEISGGHIDVPLSLSGNNDDLWEIHVVGAPDIPVESGGSKQFVCNPRVKWCKGQKLCIDADLNPKDVTGAVNQYARKILVLVMHPVGAQSEFQVRLKLYR